MSGDDDDMHREAAMTERDGAEIVDREASAEAWSLPGGQGGGDARRQLALRRAALRYLNRYLASEQDLRRVLARRLRRLEAATAEADDDERETPSSAADVEAVVASCLRAGLIDDRRFVEAKAASGRRRGWSTRRIAMTLKTRGVDGELVRDGLAAEDHQAETEAAVRFVERRRIGPAGRPGQRDAQKELAAVMRGGFSASVARAALRRVEAERREAAGEGDDPDTDDSGFGDVSPGGR